MNRFLDTPQGTPIYLILGLVLIGCAVYYYIKFRKLDYPIKRQNLFQRVKAGTSVMQKNDVKSVLKKWLPPIFFLTGIYMILEFADRIWGGTVIHLIKELVLFSEIGAICLGMGIGGLLGNAMGGETRAIEGLVVKAELNPYNKNCFIWVEYRLHEVKWIHQCTCSYSQERSPFVGQQYDLIYSPKYNKVISRDEIKSNWISCAFGFVGFILLILLVITKYT